MSSSKCICPRVEIQIEKKMFIIEKPFTNKMFAFFTMFYTYHCSDRELYLLSTHETAGWHPKPSSLIRLENYFYQDYKHYPQLNLNPYPLFIYL